MLGAARRRGDAGDGVRERPGRENRGRPQAHRLRGGRLPRRGGRPERARSPVRFFARLPEVCARRPRRRALAAVRSECAMERQKATSAAATASEMERRVAELDARVREMDARARTRRRARAPRRMRGEERRMRRAAESSRKECESRAREEAAKASLALRHARSEFEMTEAGASSREASLRGGDRRGAQAAEAAADDARRLERELASARSDSTALRAARDGAASQLENELARMRAALGEAERAREAAESAARDAEGWRSARRRGAVWRSWRKSGRRQVR